MKTLHFATITILLCVIMSYVGLVSAQSPPNDLGNGSLLSITTTKNGFSAGDMIDIHGNSLPNYHVELTLVGPNGTIQDSRSTFSDRDGQFSSYLLIPKYAQGGTWKILGKSGTYNAELDFNIFEPQPGTTCQGCFLPELNNTKPAVAQISESPLEQFKSGIAANDVKCQQDLQLVIKAEDGSPACVKPQTAQKFVERGWGWAMQTIDSLKPLQPNRIANLGNDTGVATLGNQTYYFVTPNYTNTVYSNPVQISFHDVVFTLFPAGFRGGLPTSVGCGSVTVGEIVSGSSSYYWTDAKFSDGTHELLHIFADSQPCPALPIPTYFSTHANPQAGLTFYDGKMKLLVSTDSQAIEKKFSVIPSQVEKQSKTVDATILQCENEFKPRETQHTTFPNGTSLTTIYMPVFLMKPNSTGKICITNNIASQSTNQSFISAKTTAGVSKENSETSDVTVVSYPESIVIDNTTKTVVYTITTSKDANGFYRISTTFDFCGSGIPLGVGYNSSHLFDNDFPWLGQTMPCPFNSFQSVQTQITGLTGIDVAYITKVYS